MEWTAVADRSLWLKVVAGAGPAIDRRSVTWRKRTRMGIAYLVITTSETAAVRMNCPACGSAGVASTATESLERVQASGPDPDPQASQHLGECGNCHKTCVCKASLEQLRRAKARTSAPFLRYRPSGVPNFYRSPR